ncbi:hypothetical protein FBZ87_112122 [Nitrospirillum amazonense]|uniref:DUF4142 domain-containing protein n=2 Tax=Nitrospirillum amazonense TaxID=28077 RepID=A0A560JC63_9PROT|nr:hypothetical protein [Nitrospirillum amazonense]TWB68079.1 hypothetical protein FBZ87_112122 [Nitrospirillum amazonense]
MRFAAALVVLMVSAPMLAHERLDAAEVGRYVSAAEALVASAPDDGQPAFVLLAHPGPEAKSLLASYGFDERRWRQVTQRVLAARQAARAAEEPVEKGAAAQKLASASSLSAFDRQEMAALVRWTEHDRAALEQETKQDRSVMAPFFERLDRLDASHVRPMGR